MKQLHLIPLFLCSLSLALQAQAGSSLVSGSAFTDLIKPLPRLSQMKPTWGNEGVMKRDPALGIEADDWSYWGGNPMLCEDGKYHIAVCRWPSSAGHMGWFHSEVAHAVADSPMGPYTVTGTIVKEGHNPEVVRLQDGTYALHVLNRNRVYTAKNMAGPWTLLGSQKIDKRGFRKNPNLGSNLTIAKRPDGSLLLMQKFGDTSISTSGILGPFRVAAINNYKQNSGYGEDPVMWRSRHQYHCLYNLAMQRKSFYMRSLNGLDWKQVEGLAYDEASARYENGTQSIWGKLERPKVVQDELGRAIYLSLAVIDTPDKGADKGGDIHNSKNLTMPLTKERLIDLINKQEITTDTKSFSLKITAEADFDPVRDLDVDSLRLGAESVVAHGGGAKVVSSKMEGKDIILNFEGDAGLTRFDYDLKLLGKSKKGEIIFGYALMQQDADLEAKLIAVPTQNVPHADVPTVQGIIENLGLKDSKAMHAKLFCHDAAGNWSLVQTIDLPALKPYEQFSYTAAGDANKAEYSVQFPTQRNYTGYWRMYDHTDATVTFSGDWGERKGEEYYMGAEKISQKAGNRVSFTFTGNMGRVYGYMTAGSGYGDVYVDGKIVYKDIYFRVSDNMGIVFETDYLPFGEHTIEIHTKSDAAVAIDAFASESLKNKQFFEEMR